jgi:signal transduction histidine kinase
MPPGLLVDVFSSEGFMPHGHCYQWQPGIVWLHVGSDALIALAYITIPFTLAYFVNKRRDLPFNWMFLCFGLFIVSCGATHLMEIWTLWVPSYWLSGFIKAITAAASVPTAVLLVRLVPQALALPSPEQLRLSNESLRRALSQVEEASRDLEAFSYSVAHDLRAPLRGIDGFSQALIEDHAEALGEDGKRYLGKVRAAAQRMGELIEGLLKLAHVTRGELRRTPMDLSAVASGVAQALAERQPDRRVAWAIEAGLSANGDENLVAIALENLIGNAWKFTAKRESARIEVGASERDGERVFFVRDNGAGFDMAYAPRLFRVFERLHPEAEFNGTGIGLVTVQRIIRKHGGTIWAEAAPDAGATFYFTLEAQDRR